MERRHDSGAAQRSPGRLTAVPAGFSSSDADELIQAERDVQARIGDLDVDFDAMAAVSNIFRAASMVRNHMERTVLEPEGLSFTGFVVLWVLWIWGEQEARFVAEESGISRGTLTGVANTLEGRGLVARRRHPSDRRSVLLGVTPAGQELMTRLFPRFNAEEARVSGALDAEAKHDLATHLRAVLRTVEGLD